MTKRHPTVTVCCITYNHEHFIAQAIESVLMQQTNFDVELIIGEDCSTDSTRAITIEYAKRHPGRIRVLTPSVNLGMMQNVIATLAACKGEYIAILEGDDYWTDATKLQRQVDALRTNAECAFCFHDAEIFYHVTAGRSPMLFSQHRAAHALPLPAEEGLTLKFTQLDLARLGWIVPTASLLYRASAVPQPLPAWFAGVYSGDYTLHLLSTRRGPALYLPRVMSRYRLHEHSITNSTSQSVYQFERRIYEGKMFQQHVFAPKDKKYADIYLANQYIGYAHYLGSQGKRWQQLRYLAKALFYHRQRVPLYLERRLSALQSSTSQV